MQLIGNENMKGFWKKYIESSFGIATIILIGVYLNNKINQGELNLDRILLFLALSFGAAGCMMEIN